MRIGPWEILILLIFLAIGVLIVGLIIRFAVNRNKNVNKNVVNVSNVIMTGGSRNFCTKCGEKLGTSMEFCPKCGTKIQVSAETSESK